MHRLRNILLVLGFVTVLAAPTVASIARIEPMARLDENRALAKPPAHKPWALRSAAAVTALAQEWERYFNDHFGLRKLLVGTYRLFTFHILGHVSTPSVVVGKATRDGQWLFYHASAAKDGVGMESLMGQRPYSAAQLQAMIGRLADANALATRNHLPFVIAICPDKQSLYPQHLPSRMRPPAGTRSRLDQFWGAMAGSGGVPLLDLRVPLREAGTHALLYYPSDTHWNMLGALVAYNAIAKALGIAFPFPDPLPVVEAPGIAAGRREGDLMKMLGLPVKAEDAIWMPILPDAAVLAEAKRGKLLILGDSFAESMRPYFEMHYAAVKRINGIRNPNRLGLSQALLDAEKPDALVIEAAERYWTAD